MSGESQVVEVQAAEFDNRESRIQEVARALQRKNEPWMLLASCLGTNPDVFFPGKNHKTEVAEAKSVCEGCKVKEECLEYALEEHEGGGVWGGTTERERRRIRRQRRIASQ